MTATNHALTGAVIGLSIGNPLLAIPLAFASHFVLDGIPHLGGGQISDPGSKFFRNWLTADALLCILLVIALATQQPSHWLLGSICAFVATSPDLMWAKKFFAAQSGNTVKQSKYWLARFHRKIQWFEHPSGLIVEGLWAIAAITILVKVLKV
ncbi:MAG TPA: hypothetical protein VMR28_00340 [Candidatus Saccharimonadales bacterium]|nr:hypothetical protein [Candidatus Saccharimonadales bacterium]